VKISGSDKSLYAIIDANINRAKEGLRVAEDIARFIFSDKPLSSRLKSIRHAVDRSASKIYPDYVSLLKNRDSSKDVGRKIKNKGEFQRAGLKDILISNFKRAEESLRVLEEMSKIRDVSRAREFKELRYRTYEAEKTAVLLYEKKS
jgi:hypothetical protein